MAVTNKFLNRRLIPMNRKKKKIIIFILEDLRNNKIDVKIYDSISVVVHIMVQKQTMKMLFAK